MPLALLAPLAALAQSQSGGLPDTNARVAVLEATVATLQTNLAAETAARQAADTALQNNINNVQVNITKAINSESAARQAAEAALQNSIKTVQNAINSESATRLAADTALQNQLSLVENAATYVDFKNRANTPNGDRTIVLTSQTLPAGEYVVLFSGSLNILSSSDVAGGCQLTKLSTGDVIVFEDMAAEVNGPGTLTNIYFRWTFYPRQYRRILFQRRSTFGGGRAAPDLNSCHQPASAKSPDT